MTKIIRLAAAAALATTVITSPAASTQALPTSEASHAVNITVLTWDEFGNPTSGMIEIDLNNVSSEDPSSRNPAPSAVPFGMTTQHVGGGMWTYGVEYDSLLTKRCVSNYFHNRKYHSTTAVMGAKRHTASGPPRTWATAEVTGGLLSGSCTAYWSTD